MTALTSKKLIMFGGKGGVGKTTCAASTALGISSLGKRTLILSSDPTPSLSDVFKIEIGSKITRIAENLYGLELKSNIIIEMWKEKFGKEIYEVASAFLPVGPEVIDYVAEAPGIDEQFMLAYILDLIERNEYETIVWDTAPAGHTLSILKLEEKIYDHLTDAAKMYAKVRIHLEKLRRRITGKDKRTPLEIIESWRMLAKRVMDILRNKDITEFVVVTIPEALGVFQTRRIIDEVKKFGINTGHIIINKVIPRELSKIEFLESLWKIQNKYIKMMLDEYSNKFKIIELKLYPMEIRGINALKEVWDELSKHFK